MIEEIKGITGLMYGAKARGINMGHPVEIRSIKCQIKVGTDGFATFSMRDEKDNIMLQIEVNDDVKELIRKLTEEKDNG